MITYIGKIAVIVESTEEQHRHLESEREEGQDPDPVEDLLFEIQGFRNSGIQEFRNSGIRGFGDRQIVRTYETPAFFCGLFSQS